MSDTTRRGWFGQMAAALVGAGAVRSLPTTEMAHVVKISDDTTRPPTNREIHLEFEATCLAYDPRMQDFCEALRRKNLQ